MEGKQLIYQGNLVIFSDNNLAFNDFILFRSFDGNQ